MQCSVLACGRALKPGQKKYCSMCESTMQRYEAAVNRATGPLEAYVVIHNVRVMALVELARLTGVSTDQIAGIAIRQGVTYQYQRGFMYVDHELRGRDIIAVARVLDSTRTKPYPNGATQNSPAPPAMTLAEACKYLGVKETMFRSLMVVGGIGYLTQKPRITLRQSDVHELARRIIDGELEVRKQVYQIVFESVELAS